MELVLIIIGGALSTAIIFMVIDVVRGKVPDDEDAFPLPPELQDPLPESEERS